MKSGIKTKELGKLRVYMTRNDKATPKRLINKLFPKPAFEQIVEAAREEGIMNAHVYNVHYGFTKNGRIQLEQLEQDNAQLPLCLELIDEKEKLESFFKKYKDAFKEKVVIYKSVEFWEAN